MKREIAVQVVNVIGGPQCVTTSDGQRLYDKIAPLLVADASVDLSFERVETIIPAFLNAAVGQLYGQLPEDRISSLLSFRDLADDDWEMLELVIENAKMYFNTPNDFNRAWREELGDEEE